MERGGKNSHLHTQQPHEYPKGEPNPTTTEQHNTFFHVVVNIVLGMQGRANMMRVVLYTSVLHGGWNVAAVRTVPVDHLQLVQGLVTLNKHIHNVIPQSQWGQTYVPSPIFFQHVQRDLTVTTYVHTNKHTHKLYANTHTHMCAHTDTHAQTDRQTHTNTHTHTELKKHLTEGLGCGNTELRGGLGNIVAAENKLRDHRHAPIKTRHSKT